MNDPIKSLQEYGRKVCPIHSTSCNWVFLYHSKYKDFHLPIYRCTVCGLQSQYPPPRQWRELYNEAYYSGNADYSYVDERKLFSYHCFTWDSRLKILESVWKKNFPQKEFKNLHFLEIGSGFGGFLSRAKLKGHRVQGIEVSTHSCTYANQNGIPTFLGTLEESPFPHEFFDIIVLSEVLEHLPNPKISLDKIVSLLKKNSILVIQTANFEGWQYEREKASYHYYLPGHLFYYTETLLKHALERRGIQEFRIFYGSDVSLISKLRKIRGSFQKLSDYRKWYSVVSYHLQSKFRKNGKPLTCGFVLYGIQRDRKE